MSPGRIEVGQLGAPIDVRARFELQRTALLELLRGLTADDWRRPTACPGWSVADLVAHVVGDVVGRLSGDRDGWTGARPQPGEPIEPFIDRVNEEWVLAMRRVSPEVLVGMLERLGPELEAHWDTLDLQSPAVGVSWAGLDVSPAWLDIGRELTEYWVHDRQIRDAVGAPDPVDDLLPTLLDVFARGLPHALRDESGEWLSVIAEHPVGDQRWVLRHRDGRWSLLDADPPDGTPEVRVDADLLWRRWVRDPSTDAIRVGATGLRAAVLDHVAIVRSEP